MYTAPGLFSPLEPTVPDADRAPPDTLVGQILLEQFVVLARIGAGGMGTVYRARQLHLDRDVAIKVLHDELADGANARSRFRREARVTAALEHPNVVRVFLSGELEGGSPYLVMEHLDGRSLAHVLRAHGTLPVPRALHVMAQICSAMGAAHRQGVVHRDLKPSNVQLVRRGDDEDFVKVLDFGVARCLAPPHTTLVTQAGLVFGTARYISPEGAAGEPTDARSDVYSLGVLAYELLCGETPFDATSVRELFDRHVNATAPDIRTRRRGTQVPRELAAVLARALAKRPDARYADATALGAAFEQTLTSLPSSDTLAGAPSPFATEDETVSLRPIRTPRAPSPLGIAATAFLGGAAAAAMTCALLFHATPTATHRPHTRFVAAHRVAATEVTRPHAPVAAHAPLPAQVLTPDPLPSLDATVIAQHHAVRRARRATWRPSAATTRAPPPVASDGIDWTAPPPPQLGGR